MFLEISVINAKNASVILNLEIIAAKISPEAKALGMLMYGSEKASYGMIPVYLK